MCLSQPELWTSLVGKHFEHQHCPCLSKRPRITDRLVTRELWLQFRFSILNPKVAACKWA